MIAEKQECIIIELNKTTGNKIFNPSKEKLLFKTAYNLYKKAEKRNILPIPVYIENNYFYAHDKRFFIRFKICHNFPIRGHFFINKISENKYILEKTKNPFKTEYPSIIRKEKDLKYLTCFYFSKKLFKANVITILRKIPIDIEYLQMIPVLGDQYSMFHENDNLVLMCKEYDLYIIIMRFNYENIRHV